jgi:hypothetical protein
MAAGTAAHDILVTLFPPLRYLQLKQLEINPDDYILGRGLLKRGAWTLFTGGTGIGKGVAVAQFAGCIAGGKHIFGLTVSRPFKVLLLTAEDDEEVLQRNFVAIADHEKLDPALLDANLQIHHAYALDGPELHDAVAIELARGGFDLVILDNYQAYSGASDLNDSAAWNLFIKPFERMLKERRAAMLLVDHTGKPVERKGWGRNDSVYLAAGTSRKANGARASIELYSPTGGDERYRLHFGKNWERAGVVDAQGRPVRDVYLDRAPSADAPYWTPSADQAEHRAALEGEEAIVAWATDNPGSSYQKIADATGHSKSKVGRVMQKHPELASQRGAEIS